MTIETANRLYELRKEKGLSQEELAEKLGVSRQAVSKWERSEASPDTDNLIALAKIYDLSLDELVFGEKKNEQQTNDEPQKGTNKIDIGPNGIFLESDEGDKMQINLRGIKISDGKHIKIGSDDDFDDDEDDDDDDIEISVKDKKGIFWRNLPYPILCTVAYLIFGFCDILGGWALSWIIFVTIPLYHSLIDAICKRRFSEFAYPVFTAVAYLYMGMYHHNWHPSWIVFVTIPIYYCIADILDKAISQRKIK